MAAAITTDVHTQLETLFHHGALGGLSDSELLGQFLNADAQSAEAAFAVLVDRHAPMVLRVCRSALRNTHDADDASQAVFLVLARRARSVRRLDSLAGWLYGVARRIAARARRDEARRRKLERRSAEMAANHTEPPPLVSDDCAHIYAEIDALPQIYRSAIVLSYLEGLSHEQAALSLRCPLRTFQSRLLRAKERLRQRLARRRSSLPAVLPPLANASQPSAAWVKTTAQAARAFATSTAPLTTAGVSSATISLARSRIRAAVLVPRMLASVLVTTGFAVVVIAVARFGFNTDPPIPPPESSSQSVAAAQPKKDPNNRTLVVRVVDRDSTSSMEGVEVVVQTDSGARPGLGGDPEEMARFPTGKNGQCRIEFPRTLPKEIYITARKAGYADRGYGPLLEPGLAAIPDSHTINMERGLTIGGIVKARNGMPVAEATVIITARAGDGGSPDWSYVPEAKVTTDVQGRWHFDRMPSGWNNMYVKVTHPGYVPTFMQRDVPAPSDLMLKARKAETILDEGVALAGKVVDQKGRPLAGATVGLGADRQVMQRGFPSATTDSAGRFQFEHVPPGTQTVTAQAPGHAPELAEIIVAPGTQPLEFRLGPGHTIRARVLNPAGQPLDGVTVQAANWKGHSSLDWTTKTDSLGRFAWDGAPAEPVFLTLTKPGYTMVVQREFQADKGETTVAMYPPLRVRGRVTDGATGKPIDQFTVVHGNYDRFSNRDGALRNVHWQRGGPHTDFAEGVYEVEFSVAHVAAVAVRVEARGYKPATSQPFKMEAGDVAFDTQLEPGVGPTGVVHGPDGRPLSGAAVIVSTKSLRAQLYNGKFHETAYPRVLTGADGRFRFPAQNEPFRLFVDHETGYAEADEKSFAASEVISLKPWGRIQGTVQIGRNPAAGVQVRLSETDNRWARDEAMPITQSQQLKTDSRGRYAFERVIPARLTVSRIFTLERSSFHVGTGAAQTVTVQPDRTSWVNLGGAGRPVVGRFVVPAGIKPGAFFPYLYQTLASEGCTYDTNVRPDGRFRIEDIPAGKYRLQAQLHAPGTGVPGTFGPELASSDTEIIVPAIPGDRSDEPLDLGTIDLKPINAPGSD